MGALLHPARQRIAAANTTRFMPRRYPRPAKSPRPIPPRSTSSLYGLGELFQDQFDDQDQLNAPFDTRIGLDAAIDQFQ